MAGLLIFIGIGIIVTTILKTQSRMAHRKPKGDQLRELQERLRRGEDVGGSTDEGATRHDGELDGERDGREGD